MSSLEAHAILQQDTAESIPCNGDKEQWLWLEAQRTKLSQKLLLMAPTSFWLSSLSVSHLRVGSLQCPGTAPWLLSRILSLPSSTPHPGGICDRLSPWIWCWVSVAASASACAALPARAEQARACFACLIWQGHPAHSSPHEALGFLIWFISCHFGHFVLLWLASQQLLPFMSCLPKEASARREGGQGAKRGERKGPPKIVCAVQWGGCKLKQIWCQKDLFLGTFNSLGEFMSPSCCPRSQPAPSSSDASRVKFPLLKNEQLCPPL